MTLVLLQWDSYSKWYAVRPRGDKGQWGGRTLFQFNFNFKLSANTIVTWLLTSHLWTLHNGAFGSRGLQRDRKFKVQTLKKWQWMIFHEWVISCVSGASLLHLHPNISFKPKCPVFSKEDVFWWVTVLPSILEQDLALVFLLASYHRDSPTLLSPKHSSGTNYIFTGGK